MVNLQSVPAVPSQQEVQMVLHVVVPHHQYVMMEVISPHLLKPKLLKEEPEHALMVLNQNVQMETPRINVKKKKYVLE